MLNFDDPELYDAADLGDISAAQIAPLLKTNEIDFDKIFNAYIAASQKTWAHDRKASLGASEVFGCIRKAWYSRNNAPKDTDYKESWGATRRGDLIENHHVVPAMLHGLAELFPGTKLLYAGSDQHTLFHPELPLSATPDGLITGAAPNALARYGIPDIKADCFALEIKSIDPRVSLTEEKAIHHGQTQIQLGLFRDTTEFKPFYSVVLYVNASFLDDMKPFPVEWNPVAYETAKARATTVFSTKDPLILMREGAIEGGCEYCPFQEICALNTTGGVPGGDKTRRRGDETDPVLRSELERLVREEKLIGKESKNAQAKHGLIKEEIKLKLRQFKTNRAAGDGWKVSYSASDGRKTYDVKAMEADGIDLSPYEKQGNGFEILRITADVPGE